MNIFYTTIVNENIARYKNGREVDIYLQEDYHIKRIQKGINMLESLLYNRFSNIPKNKIKILDIAGSTGAVAAQLQKRGYITFLSDIEKDALKVAKERDPGLRCVQMDASQEFPFDDNSFHAIFAGEIIEHIFDSQLFVRECARCLKNNGVLVITTPNLATIQDRIRFLFGKSPRQINPLHEYLYLHIRPFTVSKLKELCKKNGFTGFTIKTNTVLWRLSKRKIVIPIIGNIIPSIGGSIILGCYLNK